MCQYGMTRNDAQDYTGDPKPINITIVNKETQTQEHIGNSFSANKENKGEAPNIFKITSIYPVNSDHLELPCKLFWQISEEEQSMKQSQMDPKPRRKKAAASYSSQQRPWNADNSS